MLIISIIMIISISRDSNLIEAGARLDSSSYMIIIIIKQWLPKLLASAGKTA